MTDQPSSPAKALLHQLEEQSALLADMCDTLHGSQWEYLVVQIRAQKDRWYEYWGNGKKFENLDNKAVYYVLNVLGRDRWELVHVLPSGDFYFKRPRR